MQFGDAQWFRGKSLDGFCPLGPELVDASAFDSTDVRVRQRLNDELLQDARTSDLIFTIPVLVSYISSYITLERGDIILTGTPDGVGFFRDPKIMLKDGDVSEIEIDGLGVLRNEVLVAT
jgi:2-keto-4-pentenoate hydratase/2-oxohepta-3-ene-1,7-dioic acid hydratase in catechol pathway